MVPLLTKRYGLPAERITYFPHWSAVECDAAMSFDQSRFVQEWQLQGKFVVQYSGNMGIWNDMEGLVTVAHTLRYDTGIRFVFIGGGIGSQIPIKYKSIYVSIGVVSTAILITITYTIFY